LDPAWVDEVRRALPELPDAKKKRFVEKLGLSPYDAGVLVNDKETAAFYEAVVADGKRDAKMAANWVTGDYFAALNRSGVDLSAAPVGAGKLAELLDLISAGTISGRIAKEVFEEMWETGKAAADIVEAKGLTQISDTGAIEALVDQVIADNPGQVEQIKAGNEKLMGWFVGQVMKVTQGKANPGMVNQLLRKKLS
jgi:aspartyl-tRNA(Asn)/glutamyl-tRNA(Gln) amidotransferase subunit B